MQASTRLLWQAHSDRRPEPRDQLLENASAFSDVDLDTGTPSQFIILHRGGRSISVIPKAVLTEKDGTIFIELEHPKGTERVSICRDTLADAKGPDWLHTDSGYSTTSDSPIHLAPIPRCRWQKHTRMRTYRNISSLTKGCRVDLVSTVACPLLITSDRDLMNMLDEVAQNVEWMASPLYHPQELSTCHTIRHWSDSSRVTTK